MKAVILAGGQGTRLGKLTSEIPKPMIQVVGKPLLEYHIEWLKRNQIQDIFITVNYLKDAIINYFGNGEKWGVNIQYFEELNPLGTVGGVKELENDLDNEFLVVYGDVMIDMDLNRLIQFHRTKKADATLVVHPNDHPYDSDLVQLDNNDRVVEFKSKPHDDNAYYANLVNAGVYLLTRKVLQFVAKGKKSDFGRDVFPTLIHQLQFYGYSTSEYLKDMGTPDRLVKVEEAVMSGKVFNRNLKNPQVAIFLDRDGVINDDTEFIHSPNEFKLLPETAAGIKLINQSDYLSIVVTNQSVIARNLCTEEGLQKIHNKMEWDLGLEQAYVDRIYYCPHHPDKGYPEENPAYKIDCECRKPKPGMLLQAAEKFNIDLPKSYLIGDHERDILAGKAAGCKTVAVRTGKGVRKTQTKPDYYFNHLKEAVEFIVNKPYQKYAKDILQNIQKSHYQPYIITIGGNTQSGKSNLATYLKQYLEENKVHVLKIELDDWILPKNKRSKYHDVMANFQRDKMSSDIKRILQGGRIDLEGYSKIQGLQPIPQSYFYGGEKVVIIEGVIALAVSYLLEISNLKIFKKINAEDHHQRVMEYFRWKGYSEEESKRLYKERKSVEYDHIGTTDNEADIIIQ